MPCINIEGNQTEKCQLLNRLGLATNWCKHIDIVNLQIEFGRYTTRYQVLLLKVGGWTLKLIMNKWLAVIWMKHNNKSNIK